MHFRCPGVTDGQIIILLEEDARSIVVASTAATHILKRFCNILLRLVQTDFPQCIYRKAKIDVKRRKLEKYRKERRDKNKKRKEKKIGEKITDI